MMGHEQSWETAAHTCAPNMLFALRGPHAEEDVRMAAWTRSALHQHLVRIYTLGQARPEDLLLLAVWKAASERLFTATCGSQRC